MTRRRESRKPLTEVRYTKPVCPLHGRDAVKIAEGWWCCQVCGGLGRVAPVKKREEEAS